MLHELLDQGPGVRRPPPGRSAKQGVRCWSAPHDLPIGGKICRHQAARQGGPILSKNSIKSDWVEDEVKTAFEEERKRKQTVLFPLQLLPSPAIGGIVHRKRLRYFYFWEDQMKQFITAGLTLAAICSGCGNSLAYINYPWCVFGESRGTDCSYRSKEECTHSGRSRGSGVSAAKIPATIPNCLTSLSNQRSDGQAMCQGRFGKKHRGLLPPVSDADRC